MSSITLSLPILGLASSKTTSFRNREDGDDKRQSRNLFDRQHSEARRTNGALVHRLSAWLAHLEAQYLPSA